MNWIAYLIVSATGICIGSFLNVVIFRYNSGMTMAGHSRCLSCGKRLSWLMLVPLLSYLFARGRCRYCGVRVSVQYPVVEALAGGLFALAYWHSGIDIARALPDTLAIGRLALDLILLSLLLAIAVYDLRHKIIPDLFAFLFGLTAFIRFVFSAWLMTHSFAFLSTHTFLIDLSAGFWIPLPFALMWLLSRGRWMGLGDAKLSVGIGWMLGLYVAITSTILAFWSGAIVGIVLLSLRRHAYTMKSEIPFGPFLIATAIVMYLYPMDIPGLSHF